MVITVRWQLSWTLRVRQRLLVAVGLSPSSGFPRIVGLGIGTFEHLAGSVGNTGCAVIHNFGDWSDDFDIFSRHDHVIAFGPQRLRIIPNSVESNFGHRHYFTRERHPARPMEDFNGYPSHFGPWLGIMFNVELNPQMVVV